MSESKSATKRTWNDYYALCVAYESKGETINSSSKQDRCHIGAWLEKQLKGLDSLTTDQWDQLNKLVSWTDLLRRDHTLLHKLAVEIEKTGNITKNTMYHGIPLGKWIYQFRQDDEKTFEDLKCWSKWKVIGGRKKGDSDPPSVKDNSEAPLVKSDTGSSTEIDELASNLNVVVIDTKKQ